MVVSDIHNQAALLERLLDEAAALHNRTQDPSVEPKVQERLQEAYNDVRDRAEVRCLFMFSDSTLQPVTCLGTRCAYAQSHCSSCVRDAFRDPEILLRQQDDEHNTEVGVHSAAGAM